MATINKLTSLTSKETKYLRKLDFLVRGFDERDIEHFAKNNMQMVSCCQSYNIMCNQEFFSLDEALEMGKIYARDPFIDFN